MIGTNRAPWITSGGSPNVTGPGRSIEATSTAPFGVERRRVELEPSIARRNGDRSYWSYGPAQNAAPTPVAGPRRERATVLFADIKGSLELSASVALEDWWSTICGLFDLMCAGVHQFGGWIANFTGDGVAAIFNDPADDSVHAERCCQAALSLRAAVNGPAELLLSEHGLELAVRIGMHSGEIFTGPVIGGHYRCYTASGFSVSLAKRIEGLALPGHIYISEDTAKLLPPTVELRGLGSFYIKGASLPVGIFELIAVQR